jgi:hypothetical protein
MIGTDSGYLELMLRYGLLQTYSVRAKRKKASEAPKLTNRFVQYTDTINRFAKI